MMSKDVSTDRLVRAFIKIRNTRAERTREFEAADAEMKASMKLIEVELLGRAQEQGLAGYTVEGVGTTYTSEDMHASIKDDTAFFDFVRETGDLDFFERRITIKHIKEYMAANDGELPPGIHVFRELRMRVRTARAKGRSKDAERDD
ncbi:MAG TPA: hypothetical protein VF077_05870 [Nitrospiraceae bacterium]